MGWVVLGIDGQGRDDEPRTHFPLYNPYNTRGGKGLRDRLASRRTHTSDDVRARTVTE